MSIELIYGFVESDELSHINEEELLVDYSINLYSMKIENGFAVKACYGIPCVLNSDSNKSAPQIFLSCSNENIKSLLRPEDIESVQTLYNKYNKSHGKSSSIGLYLVYSSSIPFKSQPYSLRNQVECEIKSEPGNLSLCSEEHIDKFEDIYNQARAHIEEQVDSQKRVMEYLQSIQSDSSYKFKLIHNLPPKDFLFSGQITIKYEIEVYKDGELVYHVKIRSNGLYTFSDGYVGTTDQVIVLANNNFEPDEDFLGEFEGWIYLYSDETAFKELVQPLSDHFQDLI
jgi:hypothetical protein